MTCHWCGHSPASWELRPFFPYLEPDVGMAYECRSERDCNARARLVHA